MKIKELLIGLLIIIIPLSLLYICNKKIIKEQCDYNLTCIKNELENNIRNFNKSYETNESFRNRLKNKLIKKKYNKNQLTEEEEEESVPQEEEMIEPFFDGIKGWFSGSSPSSTNAPPQPMLLPPPANVHQNINESLDSLNKKKNPLVSTKFPPDDNEDIPNLLETNGINTPESDNKKTLQLKDNKIPSKMPPMMDDKIIDVDLIKSKNVKDISNNNKDIKLDNDIKLIKKDNTPPSKKQNKEESIASSSSASNTNISNLFGKCQFFNDKCPEGYNSFGNFSIEGVGSNLSLSCGNVRDTKPAKAVAEIKNNAIYEIHILEQGHGYIPSQPPRITVEGGKGNGASAEAVVDDNGYLKLIKVVNPGYNYSETPNIVIEAQSNDSNCHFCCKT
jgi:hypothetical protein